MITGKAVLKEIKRKLMNNRIEAEQLLLQVMAVQLLC